MLFVPKWRPPICLYSTRSGPRSAAAHSAAQCRTSASRSPICPATGPRIVKLSGSHSCPAANRASSLPESHFFRAAACTSTGRVQLPECPPGWCCALGTSVAGHVDKIRNRSRPRRPGADGGARARCWLADGDLLGEPVRGSAGSVFLDRQRLQARIAARGVVDEPDGRHVRLDDVDLLQRGDDQQLQAELSEQLEREPC